MADSTQAPRPEAREDRPAGRSPTIADIRDQLAAIAAQAGAQAWHITQHGLRLGDPGAPAALRAVQDAWVAPKIHPVWADALRQELRTLRAMGEAGSHAPRPWEEDARRWPPALSGEEPALSAPEHTRRLGLSAEQRQREHEARWAVIAQKLAHEATPAPRPGSGAPDRWRRSGATTRPTHGDPGRAAEPPGAVHEAAFTAYRQQVVWATSAALAQGQTPDDRQAIVMQHLTAWRQEIDRLVAQHLERLREPERLLVHDHARHQPQDNRPAPHHDRDRGSGHAREGYHR